MGSKTNIKGWGGFPKIKQAIILENNEIANNNAITIRGAGRSYGDAAMGNKVIYSPPEKELHIEDSIIEVSGATSLKDVMDYVVPRGYIIPVIPGTMHVTIGGMIAMDVHGKNHEAAGTIGNWVRELVIQLENGEILTCNNKDHNDLFCATIGGLGLTGIIIKAKIQLENIETNKFYQITSVFDNLKGLLEQLKISNKPYKVAWIDMLSSSSCLLFEGDFNVESNSSFDYKSKKGKLTFPNIPISVITPYLMKWYNYFYLKSNAKKEEQLVSIQQFFFPLDKFNYWNRLYGKNGFIQYQFLLPLDQQEVVENILNSIRLSPFKVMLAVVKIYGKKTTPALLSFPEKGYSIALDFRYEKELIPFLNELDEKLIKHGGKTYLAKDSTLSSDNFKKMYPEVKDFKEIMNKYNNGTWQSDLSKRLKIYE